MNKEVVIAAYNRDLIWVNKFNKDVKVTVYRKGTNLNNSHEIYLENNIGRDVHSFFYHIYNKYDNMSDYTFFVQDYPFDHWENLIEVINECPLKLYERCAINFDGYFGFHFNTIGSMWTLHRSNHFGVGNILKCDASGRPQDLNPNIDMKKYWNYLFKMPALNEYEFIPGGHFCITKEHVKIRSKAFYKNIIDLLESNENIPWIIERLECYIFNKNYN